MPAITESLPQAGRKLRRGVWPLGAQVRTTLDRSEKPLSIRAPESSLGRRPTGRRLQAPTPCGVTHRLVTVSEHAGHRADYEWEPLAPMVRQVSFRQSGTVRLTTTRGFDAWNRLTNIQSVAATGLVSRLRWTYDERGQRVRADWADGSWWTYSYDAYGQLQSGRRYWADGTPVAGQQFEYRHDEIGNRTAGAWGGDERGQSLHWSTNTVNRLNQYTSRTVPPYLPVSGEAATNATVTRWWGTNECAPVVRQGRYWYGEAQVNNRTGGVWGVATNLGWCGAIRIGYSRRCGRTLWHRVRRR